MWWPGHWKTLALLDAEKELEELKAVEQKRCHDASIEAEVKEKMKKEEEQAAEYFDLPVYPSGRDCWACGDQQFDICKVDLTQDGTLTIDGHRIDKGYNGRRYLKVTCNRCGATFHERFVSPEREDEIESKKPGESYVEIKEGDQA